MPERGWYSFISGKLWVDLSMEKLFKPMIKRSPLPYAPGQNVVSDVEKAKRYADEPDRIQFKAFEVAFSGDNSTHHTSLHEDGCAVAWIARKATQSSKTEARSRAPLLLLMRGSGVA